MLFTMIIEGDQTTPRPKQCKIDESLFQRIGQNDREAFEELYQLTQRAVYTYVLSMVKNADDTCDIVQETYLKIRSCAHLYVPQGKPLAWIFTIARNLTLSFFRSRKPMVDLGEDWEEDNPSYSYVEDPTDRMVLQAALNILGEEERQILLLHVVSGLKHREIAKLLKLPLSTVLSRYQRSIQKLRKFLSEGGVFD